MQWLGTIHIILYVYHYNMYITQSLYYVWGLKQQVCIQPKLKIHIRIIDKALYLIGGVYNVYVCGCRVHVIIIALNLIGGVRMWRVYVIKELAAGDIHPVVRCAVTVGGCERVCVECSGVYVGVARALGCHRWSGRGWLMLIRSWRWIEGKSSSLGSGCQ